MAAPKNNQFWKARTTFGRGKIFKTPEIMWLAACEYFDHTAKNPWIVDEVSDSVTYHGKTVKKKLVVPFTMIDLCLFLGVNTAYFRQFKADKKKCTKAFSTVIADIEEIIYSQKFKGASIGLFNSNIIARDLGLVDKQHVETENLNFNTNLTVAEAKAISEALEDEV